MQWYTTRTLGTIMFGPNLRLWVLHIILFYLYLVPGCELKPNTKHWGSLFFKQLQSLIFQLKTKMPITYINNNFFFFFKYVLRSLMGHFGDWDTDCWYSREFFARKALDRGCTTQTRIVCMARCLRKILKLVTNNLFMVIISSLPPQVT